MPSTLESPLAALRLLVAAAGFALAAPVLAQQAAPPPAAPEVRTPAAEDGVETPEVRRIDVNRARLDELVRLPRVGPVVAQRIIDHREAIGPFEKVEELLNVRGIGEKTLERLRPLVTVGPRETPAREPVSTKP